MSKVIGATVGTPIAPEALDAMVKGTYDYAKEGGFVGTEAQLGVKLATPFATPQMFGAKGDGKTDDTAAIQAALNAASLVYIPDGTYMINATNSGWGHQYEGGVKPKSNQTIILSNGATLKAIANSTGFYNIINLVNVENVHIKGGKVQGDNSTHSGTSGEFGFGVNIAGCKNITIEQMEVFDCWGDSVIIGYYNGADSANVKVINCVLHDSRRQGISVIGCTTALIQGCEIYNISGTAPQYGIDIEPDGDGIAKNIVIDTCNIYDCTGGSIVLQNEDQANNPITSVKITNCHLDLLTCIKGDDIIINTSTIEALRSAVGRLTVSDSYIIDTYLDVGGNSRFDNCRFIATTENPNITISASGYPSRVSDSIVFNNCYFETYGAANMIKAQSTTVQNNVFPFKSVRFNSCNIKIVGSSAILMSAQPFGEMVFDGCEITFGGSPWEMFGARYTAGQRLVIRDTVATCSGTASYLISLEGYTGYEIEIYNSRLVNFRNFLYGAAAAGGTISLCNNTLSNTVIVTAQGFTFAPEYLTLSTLPKYDGGVS